MINETDAINLSKLPVSIRTIKTKAAIQVKFRLKQKRNVSRIILARELQMSKIRARRLHIDDLGYRLYEIIQESVLTDE